jgi:heat shock protein HslJ
MSRDKLTLSTLIAATLALLLSGCAGGNPLAGTEWELRTFRGEPLILGTEFTLSFEQGEVRGAAGCNSYFGEYQVAGESIEIQQVAQTEMACLEPEGLMEQETRLLNALREVSEFRLLEDRLELILRDGGTMDFARRS